MRIPFPIHIPVRYATMFATVLFAVQLIEGTSVYFAVCCFLFILITTVAFNVAGGFSNTSGGYIFFYAVLAVILGISWKAALREPADSNLVVPDLTITVFLASAAGLLFAVYLSRRLTRKRALLGKLVTDDNMQSATIGCMITGIVLTLILVVVPRQNGSVLSALGQINRFLPMAIILGVIHQIRRSGGTRSISLPVLISAVVLFGFGVLSYSKEGMFTPMLCWAVAAASQRYKVSKGQLIGGVLVAAFMVYFLVPYSQYGRNFANSNGSFGDNVDISISLLSDLEKVREGDRATQERSQESDARGYFNSPQGLLDRLQMLSVDDALINITEQGHVFGMYPILFNFANFVPHFLWPNKPSIGFGNTYAHEIGGMAEDDTTTGISFSPAGEAFHMAKWIGVLVVAPILWIMLFTLFDSLCGDTRATPWGLLMIALYSHAAPESMLSGVVTMLGFSSAALIFAAMASAYVMPILGMLFVGPGRRRIERAVPVRSIPRRIGVSAPHSPTQADR